MADELQRLEAELIGVPDSAPLPAARPDAGELGAADGKRASAPGLQRAAGSVTRTGSEESGHAVVIQMAAMLTEKDRMIMQMHERVAVQYTELLAEREGTIQHLLGERDAALQREREQQQALLREREATLLRERQRHEDTQEATRGLQREKDRLLAFIARQEMTSSSPRALVLRSNDEGDTPQSVVRGESDATQSAAQFSAALTAAAAAPTVTQWLAHLKLERYAEAITKAGYDELEFLQCADPEDIEELASSIGMMPPHAKFFRKAWARLCEV